MTFCQIRGRDCFLSVCDEADEGLCWWRGCQIATEKTESGPVSPLPLFSLLRPWPADWDPLRLFSIQGFLKLPTFQRLMSLLASQKITT